MVGVLLARIGASKVLNSVFPLVFRVLEPSYFERTVYVGMEVLGNKVDLLLRLV